MSDIRCRICGEPWFDPGADMPAWQVDLFYGGKGCPCCGLNGKEAPEFVKPPDKCVFTCDNCGEIRVDQDLFFYRKNDEVYCVEELPTEHQVDGYTLCSDCVEQVTYPCGHCGKPYYDQNEDVVYSQELMTGFHYDCYCEAVSTCGHCQRTVFEEPLFDLDECAWAKAPEYDHWVCEECHEELTRRKCRDCGWVLDADEAATKVDGEWLCAECAKEVKP